MSKTKECRRCKVVKPAKEFTENLYNSDALDSYCRPCRTEWKREWRARDGNGEREQAMAVVRRKRNRELEKARWQASMEQLKK